MKISKRQIRLIIRKELLKESYALKDISSAIGSNIDKISQKLDTIKSDTDKAMVKKLLDATIKEDDLVASNKFRGWVNKNKKQNEIEKSLKAGGIESDFKLDVSTSNKRNAKNQHVISAFMAFGVDYLKDMAKSNFKKLKKDSKGGGKEKKINMSKIDVAKVPDAKNKNIPEKHVKVMIGDKGGTRLSVAIGSETGKIYSRVAGSGKPFKVYNDLRENLIFENIKPAHKIEMKDIIKALSLNPDNINNIKNNMSDKAIEKIEKIEKQVEEDSKIINAKDIILTTREDDPAGAVNRAQELSEKLGLDPAFIYAEEKKESQSKPRVMAWNVHIMRNPDFYQDKEHVITKKQQKQLTKLGFPRRKSYYGNDAIRAFRKAWKVNPYGAIIAGAWGLYQVLGSFTIENYDSPAEWAREFNEDPILFSKKAFLTWVRRPEYGKKFIDAANRGDYNYTTAKYFGNSKSEEGQKYVRKIKQYVKKYRRKFGNDWKPPGSTG